MTKIEPWVYSASTRLPFVLKIIAPIKVLPMVSRSASEGSHVLQLAIFR